VRDVRWWMSEKGNISRRRAGVPCYRSPGCGSAPTSILFSRCRSYLGGGLLSPRHLPLMSSVPLLAPSLLPSVLATRAQPFVPKQTLTLLCSAVRLSSDNTHAFTRHVALYHLALFTARSLLRHCATAFSLQSQGGLAASEKRRPPSLPFSRWSPASSRTFIGWPRCIRSVVDSP
jgi:hypothetical protein